MPSRKARLLITIVLTTFSWTQLEAHGSSERLDDDPTAILGNTAGGTDYYQITCRDEGDFHTAGLVFQIASTTPGTEPRISMTVYKETIGNIKGINAWHTENVTDITPYDGTLVGPNMCDNSNNKSFSPIGAFVGGNGVYHVIVSKDTNGGANYNMVYHCVTAQCQHTGTESQILESR